jgi:phage antirepressor YoqD-like protein
MKPRYMEMIKQSAPKTSKITEEDRLMVILRTNKYMHRDKGNTAADSEIRTAVFRYSERCRY